jgi:hypothetical protein
VIWRVVVLIAILALAVFNGVYSPRAFMIFALQGIWYPGFLPAPLTLMFVLSGAISVLLHLLITGVPAALVERYVTPNQNVSSLVWLGTMLLPTYQTVHHLGWL